MQFNRNLTVLFIAQAVLGCQLPIQIILGGLAGQELASNQGFATLPVSIVVLVSMFAAPAASMIMGRYGRRIGFLIGAIAGAIGGALCARALVIGSFPMFVTGSACIGVFMGVQGFIRFAASEVVAESQQARAISLVLAAGLVNALVGPEIVRVLGDAMDPVPFAGAYIAVIGLNILGAAILMFLRIPTPQRREKGAKHGRPLGAIVAQPTVIAAIVSGMVAYAVMSLVMTSTPLAMGDNGFDADRAADVVRWHVLAMYAPSFFTGHLISRFGHVPIISTGLGLLFVCTLIALAGVDLHHFYLALFALGLGWNFGFIGSTSLLASAHRREEQAAVQGLNDFLVFGLVAAASFASGQLLDKFSWPAVQYAAMPAIAVALVVLIVARRFR